MSTPGAPRFDPLAYDTNFFKVKMPEGTKMIVQDGAYTSHIWYTPYPIEHFRFGSITEVANHDSDVR